MDPRRLVTLVCAGLALSGCAALRDLRGGPPTAPALAVAASAQAPSPVPTVPVAAPVSPPTTLASMAPIPNPTNSPAHRTRRSAPSSPATLRHTTGVRIQPAPTPHEEGPAAISTANRAARETSTSESFVGGVQVFAYDPGRVYEVWTAPLRVTTLTLAPGETIVSKAAGDTVRWQIGETTSGEGSNRRAHVMVKPLQKGLETNLVLSTSARVYFIELKSGSAAAFNAAVSWDIGSVLPPAPPSETAAAKPELVTPAGPLDAHYRIEAKGRRPAWAPSAVMTDGVRTFLSFPADLGAHEAPGLFVVGPGGESQLVNYRQQGGLWVVDRVIEHAELRLGDRHAQVVRISRAEGGRS